MKIYRSLDQLPGEVLGGAVTIGNFDGVHKGHARLVRQLIQQAQEVGGPAVVFTFEPHPVRLLRPEAAPPPLTWTERKAELLGELGVDVMLAYPTDAALLGLPAEEFFAHVVEKCLAARAIVEGPNFHFGRDRSGTIGVLERLCDQRGVALHVVPPVELGGSYVSSSRVRDLVRQGEMRAATELLTRPYRVRGMITHGAGRGAQLGFPTANVAAIDTLIPALGVYAGAACCGQGTWPAAIHIGPNPTFGEQAVKFEVHLIGFRGPLYGEPLEVDFLCRLRDIHPFASVADLQAQLHQDVEAARRIADTAP